MAKRKAEDEARAKDLAEAKKKDKERRELETNWLKERVSKLKGDLALIATELGKPDLAETAKEELKGVKAVK